MTARAEDFLPIVTWFATIPRKLPNVPRMNKENKLQGYRPLTLGEVLSPEEREVYIHAHGKSFYHHLETVDDFPLVRATKTNVELYDTEKCIYRIFLQSACGQLENIYILERTLDSLENESLLETCASYYMMTDGGTHGRFRVMIYKKST
jgi:hypothetical protein